MDVTKLQSQELSLIRSYPKADYVKQQAIREELRKIKLQLAAVPFTKAVKQAQTKSQEEIIALALELELNLLEL
ncbi:hypothetical protein [Algivirga pacifica]|uniref:Uncharacterized protein n=1 Tax=Algivirga pacifica TaxID=1162670 RepID=A0ABP9DDQ9_9BACT